MPVLMNALDELKAVHPFIGVVVLAFKTVYTLEQKRRDNDKKIISLYVGMKDMMGALLLLKDVENDKVIAPDGTMIEDRLKSLIERTADDIKVCSNVCDAYMKKRLLAKVLLSSLWDMKLLDFVELFATRRREFEFELTMHTSKGVDKANVKLDVIGNATKELNEQMDVMKALFEQLVSPEQKVLSDLVNAKGGMKVLRNSDKMLLDLEKTASKSSSSPSVEGDRTRQVKPGDADLEVGNLREDILEDPNAAAEKNWMVFSRKFEAQKNQIIDELTLVVQRESDRVVRELKGKAHERIRDRSIHELWVEMGWRGNVKARHFVLALRDHYLEKLASETNGILGMGASAFSISTNPDAWAIKYIDVMWVQPILEAFDDDASGFITVSEVNRFTSSRPPDWSLPHWLAFWAVGFKWSIIDYARKIEDLFAQMEGVRSMVVLPPNREIVDRYFASVWVMVHSLTAAVLSQNSSQNSGTDDPKRFKSYLEAEEARLGNNLRAVDYVIDGIDTLPLIAGVGRIEKTLFPLLYLLMKRHYEVMRIMRTKILSMRELQEGAQGILYIFEAAFYRVKDLRSNFSQQRLDLEKQFESFAFGIFKFCHNLNALWTVDYVRSLDSQVIPFNNDDEDQNVGDILKLGHKEGLFLDYSGYDGCSIDYIPNCHDVDPPLKDILGNWNGYSYDREGVHLGADSMMTFVLVPGEGERDFKASVWSVKGRQTIAGRWSKGEDDVVQIKFKISFLSALWDPIFFNGRFDPEHDALTGVWGPSAELESFMGKMEFRRIPPHYLAVYPSIKELRDNKSRALWRFGIAAVRNDIRRDHWTWSYFSQRRDDRKTVVSLLVRSRWFGPPLSAEETETIHAITRRLIPSDACFYNSKVEHIRAHACVHENAECDSCGGCIGGPRLFCLDCTIKTTEFYNTLDLCCTPKCVCARVTRQDLEGAHEPSHRLVKARTNVLTRSHGRVHAAARDAFERVGETCRKIAEFSLHLEEKTGSDEQKTTIRDESLPACGKCKGRLSFPFWYCIFCEDDLYICDGCDAEGVPDLMRSSGKHTEDHHLIRCLAREKTEDKDKGSPTEQRLTTIEGRLDGMQTQLDDLTGRVGDLTGRMGDLAGHFGDLNARIGNIEQLLQRLVGDPGPEGRTA
ncbi:hypothetical protein DFH94DRAFT_671862 [Russula ochroleuca]|uniref:EF-hand domain-containing protein n=1 Tax=Russula ochroleuca TaxID=152965 RepID=A0A9P5T5P9_9AGAM|nr:hypothetical protein DFH94DRAFT_671862 [Russula ochroleuca]